MLQLEPVGALFPILGVPVVFAEKTTLRARFAIANTTGTPVSFGYDFLPDVSHTSLTESGWDRISMFREWFSLSPGWVEVRLSARWGQYV